MTATRPVSLGPAPVSHFASLAQAAGVNVPALYLGYEAYRSIVLAQEERRAS